MVFNANKLHNFQINEYFDDDYNDQPDLTLHSIHSSTEDSSSSVREVDPRLVKPMEKKEAILNNTGLFTSRAAAESNSGVVSHGFSADDCLICLL